MALLQEAEDFTLLAILRSHSRGDEYAFARGNVTKEDFRVQASVDVASIEVCMVCRVGAVAYARRHAARHTTERHCFVFRKSPRLWKRLLSFQASITMLSMRTSLRASASRTSNGAS